MNLLKIQDALKNASDDQLMGLMQSPDSSAPSYLVLSEIRRRKDMRAKQQEEPQGTVADDLASVPQTYDQAGIRALRQPGYEEEERASPDDMQEMREGGVVRMQGGGDIPYSSYSPEDEAILRNRAAIINPITGLIERVGEAFGGVFSHRPGSPNPSGGVSTRPSRNQILQSGLPPMSELERQAQEAEQEQRVSDVFNQQERTARAAEAASGRAIDSRVQAMADIRSRISGGTPAEQAIRDVLPGYRNVNEGELRQAFGLPPIIPPASPDGAQGSSSPAPVQANIPPVTVTATAPGAAPGAGQGGGAATAGTRPSTAGGGAAAGGIGGIGGASADGGIGAGIRRLEAMFPDNLSALRERLEKGATKPEERRREATNLALIEAGLRMAASKNPSFLGSIGEGATPAVQSYAQQLGQIRQDERQDIRDAFSLEQARLQRMYALGQISAAEYRTRVSEAGANARAAAMLGSTEARERMQGERLDAQARNVNITAYRAALGADAELKAIGEQIGMARAQLSGVPENRRGPIADRLQQLETARRTREAQIGSTYGIGSEDPLGLRR